MCEVPSPTFITRNNFGMYVKDLSLLSTCINYLNCLSNKLSNISTNFNHFFKQHYFKRLTLVAYKKKKRVQCNGTAGREKGLV